MSKSIITEVAVYRNGCFIVRKGNIELQKGRHNVILDSLDNCFDTATLSLSLPENLTGSNVQVEAYDEEEKEEILKEIDRKLRDIDNRIAIKQKQIEMWNANADFSNKDSLSISDMSEYIEKLPERLEKIYEEIHVLQDERKTIDKERKETLKRANSLMVKADIDAPEDGQYPFMLKYKDFRAYWNPAYEIHTMEDDKLSIMFKAKIMQNTDEDFNDAKLTLYTSNPDMSSDIPELNPVRLDYYSRPMMFKNTALRASARTEVVVEEEMAMASGAMADFDSAPFNAVSAPVGSAVNEETMTRYELSGTYDLKKNKEIVLDIEEKKIPCIYHVVAIPKLNDCGYLAANVNVNDISDLIDSSATIYHNSTYIGEIFLSVDSDKEDYDISLGRDESIRLNRKEKKKYTSNVLLKGLKKVDYEYELSIVSLKDKPCKVTMYDQIPVSQDKTITVDINNISKAHLEEESGKLTWEFDLQERENRSFELSYSVSYPKDKTINI